MIEPRPMRSDDLRAENRHRILRTLRQDGPQSRATLGAQTGLSAAALSTLLGTLTDEGVVASATAGGDQRRRRGRPQTSVALVGKAAAAVTVALTVERLRVSLFDYSGHSLEQQEQRLATRRMSTGQLLDTVRDGIREVLGRRPELQLRHIGIGFQGVTDNRSGNLAWSPILGVSQVPIRTAMAHSFQVPVSVNNDCQLIAAALHDAAASQLGDSFMTVLFSHGIGMGLYFEGKPFSGTRSSAFEFGHMLHQRDGARCRCGKRGCIEAYAGDYAIAREAAGGAIDVEPAGRVAAGRMADIISAADAGNAAALRAFALAGQAVGEGLAQLFALLDPMPVALVGGSTDAYHHMSDRMLAALRDSFATLEAPDELIHCYRDEHPLLDTGMALDALASIDRQLATAPLEAAMVQ